MGKTTTAFRLSQAEIDALDEIAGKENSNRSAVLRKALKYYTRSYHSAASQAAIIYKKSIAKQESHPLLERIASEGIKVQDAEGRDIASIENLGQLLDFVDKKVFNYDNV